MKHTFEEQKSTWPRETSTAATGNPLLRKLRNCAAFDPNSWPSMEAIFNKKRAVPRHCDVMRDEERVDEVFLLLKGWAIRYKLVADGSRQIIAFLLPGDVFPLQLLPTARMDHAIAALTACEFAYAPSESFDQAVLNDGKLAQAFWWTTMANKSVLRAWLVNLGRRNAYSRLAHLLCELWARLEMVGLVQGLSFDFPLTQQEIADAQGLTAVHTNRMMKQLRDDGLIELKRKKLTIIDPEGLCTLAEFDATYLNPGGKAPVRTARISDTDARANT